MVKVPIEILLVDDEPDFVEMLSLRLNESGHRVQAVYSGKQALELLDAQGPEVLPPFDVIILDIKMPGMDGIETLRQIKSKHPVIEVILLTGHGAVDSAVDGLKAGAFDYLLKPADYKELLQKLEAARAQKAEHEERQRLAEARALMRRSGDA
jgi:DNA-binding response OmpR family regulator